MTSFTAQSEYSIGMFDSGLGGLTVMNQLINALPNEHVVYFGDTARLPYGEKSQETIISFSREIANFLLEEQIKVLVVACSTASALALQDLQEQFSIPIIGAIQPGAELAVESSKNGRIAVLGTKGTINSKAYEKAIFSYDKDAFVMSIACPLFVPLVEESWIYHPAAKLIVEEYLKPIYENAIDTIVLGCTHYPLLKELIKEVVGDNVKIIDASYACAKAVDHVLEREKLKRENANTCSHRYFVSDDPEKFKRLGKSFLGMPIEDVLLSTKSRALLR